MSPHRVWWPFLRRVIAPGHGFVRMISQGQELLCTTDMLGHEIEREERLRSGHVCLGRQMRGPLAD